MLVEICGKATGGGFAWALPHLLKAAKKRLEKAERLALKGDYDAAARLCERLLESLPVNHPAFSYLVLKILHHQGCALMLRGRLAEAAPLFEGVAMKIDASPSDKTDLLAALCLLNAALCRREQQRFDEEVALNRQVVKRFEAHADEIINVHVCQALLNLIKTMTQLGLLSEALETCETLITRANKSDDLESRRFRAHAFYGKGIILVELGRTDRAVAAFDVALELGASDSDIGLVEQACLAFQKQCAALEFLDRKDEIPDQVKRFKDALCATRKSDLWSKLLDEFERKATAHKAAGRHKEALESFSIATLLLEQDESLKRSHRHALALFHRTACLDQLGDDARARAMHRRLESMHKHAENPQVRLLVAKSMDREGVRLLLTGQHEYAIKVFRRLIAGFIAEQSEEISEILGRAMIKLAMVLTASERHQEALDVTRAVIARFDGSVDSACQLIVVTAIHLQGHCLFQLERFKESIAAFDEELARCRLASAPELSQRVSRAALARARAQCAWFESQNQLIGLGNRAA